MPTKPSANERQLAKLLREIYAEQYDGTGNVRSLRADAASLARRGVLAVSAKTVPRDFTDADIGPLHFADFLRRLAWGSP